MALYVVRHAHAGQRSAWTGDDTIRPLSGKGRAQADGIARLLADRGITRILSSPATRCVQTVEPLSRKLDLPVEVDQRLFEDVGVREAMKLVEETADVDAVLCSHGDVIPEVLGRLASAGMQPASQLVWPKASTWEIERVDGRWGVGRFHAPPAGD